MASLSKSSSSGLGFERKDSSITDKLMKSLDAISTCGRLMDDAKESNMNSEQIRAEIIKFIGHIKDFKGLVEELKDPKAQELSEVCWREAHALESMLDGTNSSDFGKVSNFILPAVMAIAASTKYYFSLRAADIQSQSAKQLPEYEEPPKQGSRSQMTLDILGFTKTCTKISIYLKSGTIDRKILLNHLSSLLFYIKRFLSDDHFTNLTGQDSIERFLGLVKDIREMQDKDSISHEEVEALVAGLTPLAAYVKSAAFAIHKSGSENSLSSVARKISASPTDFDISISTDAGRLSGLRNDFHLSSSLGSASLLDIGSIEIEPSPTIERKKFQNPKSPLVQSPKMSRQSLSQLDQVVMLQKKGSFSSISGIDAPIDVVPTNLQIKSIVPTSVDIAPTINSIGGAKYGVVLDVTFLKGKAEDTKSIRKTDRDIRQLSEKLVSTGFGGLPKVMEYIGGKPDVHEINALLETSKVFFQAINNNSTIIKSQPILVFANEGLVSLEMAPKAPQSPTPIRDGLRSPAQEPEATFFTPYVASSSNRFSIIQVDDSRRSSIDTISSKSSKYFSFRASKVFGTIKGDRTSFMDDSEKEISQNRSNSIFTIPTASEPAEGSSWTLSRSSKIFSFGGMGTIKMSGNDLRPKSDPVGRNKSDSISKADVNRSNSDLIQLGRKKFDHFFENAKDKGFVRTAEDAVTLFKDGKEIMVVKNLNGSPKVVAVDMEFLVESIITGQPISDPTFVECFLITYRHFMKPHELLIKIVEKYKESSVNASSETETGQIQIASFLSLWVSVSWDDFEKDKNLQNILNRFIDIIKNSKKVSHMAAQINGIVENQRAAFEAARKAAEEKEQSVKGLISNVGVAEFASLDVNLIAQQLTKIDFEMLSGFKSVDFAEHIWTKEANVILINSWINRFNQVSFWVATEICTTPLLKQRVTVLEMMIKLLKAVKDLNNYNAVMAILSGLSSSSVRRLKKTWEALNPKLAAVLVEIEKLMDPQFNYQVYRDCELRSKSQSLIPFLGLYFKDLTFANDGNPKTLPNGLINFSKNWSIYDIIERIRQFQSIPYDIEENEKYYQYCKKFIALPEKRLYSYSLLCEPRTAGSNNKEPGNTDTVRLIEKWSK